MAYSRPLAGEPLALDLINSAWPEAYGWQDLLADRPGHEQWLEENGLEESATPAARRALVEARTAIRDVLERPGKRSTQALDAVLDRGRLRLRLAGEQLEVARDWRAPWLAARDLLRLLAEHPDRVRKCANPECVLWFLDTTRSGTRRWCSMAGCGNRLKARRHYRRQQA